MTGANYIVPFSHGQGITYDQHLQMTQYVHHVKDGIHEITRKNTDRIVRAHADSTEIISNDLKNVQNNQLQVHSAIRNQTSALKQIDSTLSVGFNEVNSNLHRINEGMYGLKSSFEAGMSAIVTQFELQRKEIQTGLERIAEILESPARTKAMEHFRNGKNTFERFHRKTEKGDNLKFTELLKIAHKDFIQSIEIYDRIPEAYLYLGHIYQKPYDFLNDDFSKKMQKSFYYYDRCFVYSIDNEIYELAAYGAYNAGWIAYVLKDIDQAIVQTEKSINYDDKNNPEAYYNLAKFYAYKQNSKKAIEFLDKAIKDFDFNYAEKVYSDADFYKIKNEIDDYSTKIRDNEAKRIQNNRNNIGL